MTKTDFVKENNKLVIYLYGEIDHHGANKIKDTIDYEIMTTNPEIVVMNFSNITFMDSSGIGLVLARLKIAESCNAKLYVEGVDKSIGKILALAGIKTIQNIKI